MHSKLNSAAKENSRLLVNASKTAKYKKELLLKIYQMINFKKKSNYEIKDIPLKDNQNSKETEIVVMKSFKIS